MKPDVSLVCAIAWGVKWTVM